MNTKLYVANLSYNTSEDQLRELFSQAGHVKSVTRPVDRVTKLARDFAFIEMGTAAEASKAIQSLNGQEVDGREIKVSEARARERDTAGSALDRRGGHHGRDHHIRGDSRSGFGRGSGHRGRG
ncbi:MAG: RNA-binding protein [Chloroflexi bacterium]|nr:RNA-binding protein [Chloroflexota bacterium]